mgnify:CR=1 FL=1
MSRKMRIVVMALFAVVVMAFLVGCNDTPSTDPAQESLEKARSRVVETFSDEDLHTVQQAVHEMHETLNDLVGWGRIKTYVSQDDATWGPIVDPKEGVAVKLIEEVDKLLPLVEDETLKLDFQAFRKLIEIAAEKRLDVALMYAHRMIHDLDYWVFNVDKSSDTSRDYWGATATLHGKDGNPYYEWLEGRYYENH